MRFSACCPSQTWPSLVHIKHIISEAFHSLQSRINYKKPSHRISQGSGLFVASVKKQKSNKKKTIEKQIKNVASIE